MLEFQKQSDGTWKRFGEALPEEEPVTIVFHNARSNPPYRTFGSLTSVPAIDAPEPDKVRHSGAVEGEFTWPEATAIVEEIIRNGKAAENNLCRIQSAIYRVIEDGFDLAQRDLIARHPEWLAQKSTLTVAPDFHKFSIDIYRASDGQAVMSRGGSLELVQLIKQRLSQKFAGRISDPSGNVIDEWKAA